MNQEKSAQAVNLQLIQAPSQGDEISLYEVFCIFNRYRKHMLAILLICTGCAFIYALILPPVYQATAYLMPPHERDYLDLNVKGSLLTKAQVFQEFLNNYNSRSARLLFFKKNNFFEETGAAKSLSEESTESAYTKIQKQLIIEDFSRKDGGTLKAAKFSASEAKFAAEWLNKFIDFTNQRTVDSLKQNVLKTLSKKKADLSLKMDNLRATEQRRKEDRIAVLSEALETATRLGLKRSSLPKFTKEEASSSSNKNNANEEELLYSRGIPALTAELEAIKTRKNNDPFIESLREIEEEVYLLDSIIDNLNSNNDIASVIVDQYALVPEHRIKPNRKKILLLGFVAGLVLALAFAVMLNAVSTARVRARAE